jgi:hypothetical protein
MTPNRPLMIDDLIDPDRLGLKSDRRAISSFATCSILFANVSRNRTTLPGTCQPVPEYRSSRQASSVRPVSSLINRSTLIIGVTSVR